MLQRLGNVLWICLTVVLPGFLFMAIKAELGIMIAWFLTVGVVVTYIALILFIESCINWLITGKFEPILDRSIEKM